MLRVYVNKKLAREDASVKPDTDIRVDKGQIVLGIDLEGRKVVKHRIKRGKRVLRVDLVTK
jgi:hypothetical protein